MWYALRASTALLGSPKLRKVPAGIIWPHTTGSSAARRMLQTNAFEWLSGPSGTRVEALSRNTGSCGSGVDRDGTADVHRAIQGLRRLRRRPQQYLGEAKVLAQKRTDWNRDVYTPTSQPDRPY